MKITYTQDIHRRCVLCMCTEKFLFKIYTRIQQTEYSAAILKFDKDRIGYDRIGKDRMQDA